jgi:hypothetical protein
MIGGRRLAGAGVALMAALLAQPGAVLAGAKVDNYGATAESWGLDIRVIAIQQAGTFPDLADEYYPHTRTDIDSLPHAKADGEFFDPGGTVRTGPNLGNQVFLVPNGAPPVFPNYPYIAATSSDANAQRDVDVSAGQPFTAEPGFLNIPVPPLVQLAPNGFGAGTAHAHADATPSSKAVGAINDVHTTTVNVGSISGESTTALASDVVTATTNTVMKNIDLLPPGANQPGVIHMDSATVTGKITTSGAGTAKTEQSAQYSGVTVAGVPSTIDQDGLHVGGSGVPASAAQAAQVVLNQALALSGATFTNPHATGTTKPDGSAEVHVVGFGIEHTDKVNIDSSLTLGQADLTARAAPAAPTTAAGAGAGAGSNASVGTTGSSTAGIPGSTFGGGGATNRGRHPHPAGLTVTNTGDGWHFLILPLVALFAEVALVGMVWQANRWRNRQEEDPDLLLAL